MNSPFNKAEPKRTHITCVLCEHSFNTNTITHRECNIGNVAICYICADADNVSEKINKKYKNPNYDYSKLKTIYELKCNKCNQSTKVIIIGLRNIGVQDYINLCCLQCK